jgi:hypothetical protein
MGILEEAASQALGGGTPAAPAQLASSLQPQRPQTLMEMHENLRADFNNLLNRFNQNESLLNQVISQLHSRIASLEHQLGIPTPDLPQ